MRNHNQTDIRTPLVMRSFCILVALSAVAAPGLASAAGFEILRPHRAVYDVKLHESENRSGIKSMNGRIVYEVTGNECEGISVRYRFVTNVQANSDLFITDQRTVTHESPDGKEFSFQSNSFVNEIADEKVSGVARLTDESTVVKLNGAKKKELELEKSIFVTSHLINVIAQAKEGGRIVQSDIFDGTGKADEVVRSTSFIGNARAVGDVLDGENKSAIDLLDAGKAWPVTTSYFKLKMDNTSESLPIYEASFLLYENGVSRDLLMSYPEYALKASLSDLVYLDQTPCKN